MATVDHDFPINLHWQSINCLMGGEGAQSATASSHKLGGE
jgi:hypothetical protein